VAKTSKAFLRCLALTTEPTYVPIAARKKHLMIISPHKKINPMNDTMTSKKQMAQFKFKPTKLDEIKDRVYFKVFVLTIILFILMLQTFSIIGQ